MASRSSEVNFTKNYTLLYLFLFFKVRGPSASPFSSRFASSSTSHPTTHLCHHSITTSHHSFTLSLQAQNLPFQQILSTVDFFHLLDCLTITGLDRTYHAHHFIFSFAFYFFLFVPCGRLSWLPVSFLLHVKYALSYRIVS